jgi:uncharacterized protein YhaN
VREEGRPDLHIVFGPNEAGKTTAFEGYLDLLFGIPGRSKYNFLHEYENMRVGGALELDGNPVELVRIKRNKGDLITPSGDPANLAQLSHALDGIDREQYCAMFSLDDETIEAGGEDILASQGNLGELLFSAAAGLSDLGAVLEAARGEVDQFHKARARKTELAEAKRKLQELHAQIRELDVPASAFRRLKDERDSAAKLLSQAKQARDALLEQQAHLEAAVECLPLLQTLKDGDKELSAYIGYPSLPDGAEKEAQDLKSRHVEAATRLRHATIQKEKEEQARDALILDPVIENIADELTVLLDAAKSRARQPKRIFQSARPNSTDLRRSFRHSLMSSNLTGQTMVRCRRHALHVSRRFAVIMLKPRVSLQMRKRKRLTLTRKSNRWNNPTMISQVCLLLAISKRF